MTISEVLHAAADSIDARDEWRRDRDYLHGAGGQVYVDLFEAAKRLYGWPAVEHLERILRTELPSGQLQHWREADWRRVAKTLRDAAGIPVPADAETVALRRQLDDLAARVAAHVPSFPSHDPDRMVDAMTARIAALEAENAALRARLEG